MPKSETNTTTQPSGRAFPWFCPRCRKQEVWQETIPYRAERTQAGQQVAIDIPEFTVPRCRNCGELVFNYPAEEQIRKAIEAQFASRSGGSAAAPMQRESSPGGGGNSEESQSENADRIEQVPPR
jgi:predicted nucleic-acid-binding Zn-ribbon protein